MHANIILCYNLRELAIDAEDVNLICFRTDGRHWSIVSRSSAAWHTPIGVRPMDIPCHALIITRDSYHQHVCVYMCMHANRIRAQHLYIKILA